MNLNDLKSELEQDLPIDMTQLQSEAAQNPVLYGKWLRYMNDFRMQHKRSSNTKAKAVRDRLMYYTGRGDDICMDQYDKTELRMIIPADDTVLKADTEMEIITIMIDLCKGSMEAIKQRGYAIKAIIEQRQLESGR
jgi:hypothetical protein